MDSTTIVVIHCVTALLVVGVGLYVAYADRLRRPSMHIAVLAVGTLGVLVLAVSGVYVMNIWAGVMEHFDFSGLMGKGIRPRGHLTGYYFIPSFSTVLGLAATFVFGRLLFQQLRDFEYL